MSELIDTVETILDCWGNRTWAAPRPYIEKTVQLFRGANNVLECGTGATTLAMSWYMQASGEYKDVVCLEQDPMWQNRVENFLHLMHDKSITVLGAQIRNYGDYSWYDTDSLSDNKGPYDLVICDGPRGHRYGCLPSIYGLLTPDAKILMDDANREIAAETVSMWSRNHDFSMELMPDGRGMAILSMTGGGEMVN